MLNLLEKDVLMFSGQYVRVGILNKIQHFYIWIQLNFMGIPEYACNPEHVNEPEHIINRVSALKSHLQAGYKAVHTTQCHKMDKILFT